jgi:hypothetical protein
VVEVSIDSGLLTACDEYGIGPCDEIDTVAGYCRGMLVRSSPVSRNDFFACMDSRMPGHTIVDPQCKLAAERCTSARAPCRRFGYLEDQCGSSTSPACEANRRYFLDCEARAETSCATPAACEAALATSCEAGRHIVDDCGMATDPPMVHRP